MAKDGGDFTASWALRTHGVGTGALHQALLLVFPLLFWRAMKEILGQRAFCCGEVITTGKSHWFILACALTRD